MKKTTSENLAERLVKYGAFSAAIIGAADASGQIVYTDIADETVNASNPRVSVDIDLDGTGDYLFGTRVSPPGFAVIFPASASTATSYNSNAIVGNGSYPYYYPSNLAEGATIDGTNSVFSFTRGDFNYNNCAYPGSQFCDGNDGFVGIHFKIGTNTHYGWIRIQVSPDATSIIIKDFAYNTVPNEAIEAGQTTLGIGNFESDAYGITCKDKIINVYNNIGKVAYGVFDLTGKLVVSGNSQMESFKIDGSSLSSGIYVVELNNESKNAIVRKKVVLD